MTGVHKVSIYEWVSIFVLPAFTLFKKSDYTHKFVFTIQ